MTGSQVALLNCYGQRQCLNGAQLGGNENLQWLSSGRNDSVVKVELELLHCICIVEVVRKSLRK